MRKEGTVPGIRQWAQSTKYTGLAHGWLGWAWVWLHLRKRGLIEDSARTRQAILDHLKREIRTAPLTDYTSPLLGSGAAPVVAALGENTHPEFRGLVAPAVKRWVRHCRSSQRRDLMLGSAGSLLGCSEIEGHLPGTIRRDFLRRLHDECTQELSVGLAQARHSSLFLGLSHGFAGLFLALETGAATLSLPFPNRLRSSCLQILAQERLEGPRQASAWPMYSGTPGVAMQSWCHGAPGIGLALIAAYRLTGKTECLRLALPAIRGTHIFHGRSSSFCCGSLGRSHILLEAFRITGDAVWKRRAKEVMTKRPWTEPPRTVRKRGFYQGRLGALYLQWRFAHPKELPLPGLGVLSC